MIDLSKDAVSPQGLLYTGVTFVQEKFRTSTRIQLIYNQSINNIVISEVGLWFS